MSIAKNLLIGTAVAVGVAAAAVFALAPMYTGNRIEQDFRAGIAQYAQKPGGARANVESYERGWRSSVAVTHWTIPGADIDFRLRHEIRHGPDPQFAVARIETTPVVPSSAQAEVQRLFNGPPLTATTIIGSGETTTTIVSPKVAMTQTRDPAVKVGWGGLNAVLTQRGQRIDLRGEIPSIAFANDAKHEQIQIDGIRIDGDAMTNGTGMPLVGAGSFSFASMQMNTAEIGALKIGATRMASRSDERGDVLDVQFAFSNEGMASSGGVQAPLTIKRCDLEYRLRNLDKAAYQQYQQQVSGIYASVGDDQSRAAEAAARAMTAATDLLRAVALRSPVMEIPKLHVALEQGAVDGTLTATFNGTGLASWPPAMDEALRRLTVNATLRAPESLLRMAAETRARETAVQMLAMQNTEASEENIRAASLGVVEQQMQMLAQMPYLKREGSDYSSTLTLQAGELKVNGQLLFGGAAGLGFGGVAAPPIDAMAPQASPLMPPQMPAPGSN